MSDLSSTLAPYVYEGVEFPGTDTRVTWGHDSAKHQGYLKRGQVSETTGQRARVFTVRVPLRNGIRWSGPKRLYPETYLDLREKLKVAIGFLTHPSYGFVEVHLDDVVETIDPTRPDGLDLDLTFTEQDGDAQELELALTGPAASTPSEAAVARATEADTAAATLAASNEGWTWTSLSGEVSDGFDHLQEAERPFTEAASTFSALSDSIRARLVDPVAAGAEGHDLRAALSRCLASVEAYRGEYLGAEEPETVTLPEAMGIARAALHAYGDPTRGADLAARNRIADPALIPAGTVLVI
jgi:prophage DNA circulation protein